MTTKRQKMAVSFCEEFTDGKFEGDINDFNQVSRFLSEWLDHAKCVAEDVMSVNEWDINGWD